MPSVKTTTHNGWRSLRISNGPVELILTPQVGGRVTGCLYKGKSLFYVDPAYRGDVPPAPPASALKKTKLARGFRLYGGYKTWLSPQDDWPDAIPYYDLDSGHYAWAVEKKANRVRVFLQSPDCRESGIRLSKEITLEKGKPAVAIRQTMTNVSKRKTRFGLWDVTQFDRPGVVFVPGEKLKVFDVETPDELAWKCVKDVGGASVIRCDDTTRFKFGSASDTGRLTGFVPAGKGRWIFFTQTYSGVRGELCGHGCSMEVFNSDSKPNFEIEIHSAVRTLGPGESFEWGSRWELGQTAHLPAAPNELKPFIG